MFNNHRPSVFSFNLYVVFLSNNKSWYIGQVLFQYFNVKVMFEFLFFRIITYCISYNPFIYLHVIPVIRWIKETYLTVIIQQGP